MSGTFNRRSFTLAVLALAACTRLSLASAADAWPSKPIKLVVPSSPGGGGDVMRAP